MKLLKYTITVVLLISLAACSVNEENFPVPLDEVLNNNGAYLRVLEVQSAGFDILDLENAAYTFRGEVFDRQEGDLLESVDFFVSYSSSDGTEIGETDQPIETYPASAFTPGGEKNLPQATFDITIDEVLGPLGLTTDDLLIGDTFRVRWVVNLTDGRTFSAADANPTVTGGAFYSSPYLANVGVVAAIPQDEFVGSYSFTQTTNSGTTSLAFAAFGTSTWMFNGAQTFDTDVTVNSDNTLNGRVFTAAPFATFRGGPPPDNIPFSIALANNPEDNSVTLDGRVDTGVACSAIGISYGPAPTGAGDFDVTDDSAFTMVIRENIDGDCGLAAVDIPFEATKN